MNFLAPIDPRTLLYVARAEDRSGPWLWALDVERKVDAPGDARASSNTRRCRPAATAGASSPPSPTPPPACGACRSLDRLAEDRDVRAVPAARPRGRWRRASAGHRCSICPPAGAGDGLWRFQDGQASEVWKSAGRRVVRTARGVARRKPRGRRRQTGREAAAVDHVGGRHERTNAGRVDRHPRGGRPGHGGLVAGRQPGSWQAAATRRVRGCSRSPWTAARPSASSPGQALNPVWSPDGNLIVYAGPLVGGAGPICSG